MPHSNSLENSKYLEKFADRHIGPSQQDIFSMLKALSFDSLEELIEKTVPASIRSSDADKLPKAMGEHQALEHLAKIARENNVFKSYIGLGYHDTFTPNVILRNVLENPGWYTAYTPYQPEIAQGRLEGLLNFQQMIVDLTEMDMANASMLDEATAVAEAMAMAKRVVKSNRSDQFFVDENCYPQTIEVIKTRAEHFGFEVIIDAPSNLEAHDFFGAVIQYPSVNGELLALSSLVEKVHARSAIAIVAADIMSLMLLKSPGSCGADIVVGCNQRFGIPMGFGGPHAAFFAFKEKYKRSTPGRIIGLSRDKRGKPALRMAMQTREQHIRREKANSNICTSQVLLALMSAFYAMYHGNQGVTQIAQRIHRYTKILSVGLTEIGLKSCNDNYFDTLIFDVGAKQSVFYENALKQEINLRKVDTTKLAISINECTTVKDIESLLNVFSETALAPEKLEHIATLADSLEAIPQNLKRPTPGLKHEIFEKYHSETEMLRYLKKLETKDIALNHAMIPLGSCTMKLNATAEMIPIAWPEFSNMHPFAPIEQCQGYLKLFEQLEFMLSCCTGYDAISLQPNAGSQGEYAGLVAIKKYFESKQEFNRNICLIPASAHGTNPASAQMVSMQVVVIKCDTKGNVDLNDLKQKISDYGQSIAALMVTYPSTHGVFEEEISTICELIHSVGAQVYIDGANMNALVGLAAPGKFGGDVSHLNLHKTFCIPHGGGGPGMGPIGVKSHLEPFLPSHPLQKVGSDNLNNGTIAAAPWGSASILVISWMYITMMGEKGVKTSSEIAILNANYIAQRLKNFFPILYTGKNQRVAHECLLDLRPIKEKSGISEEDIAKRLMDYGFHAPTMSFPVPGTLMIEPTESESKFELDKFCDAMISIYEEIEKVIQGDWPLENNPLVNAPHTINDLIEDEWRYPYSKKTASYPLSYLEDKKIWPSVNRIDNVYGDRNLICSCPSISEYDLTDN